MMQALGVSPDVIDRCQNHVLAGAKVRRHYLTHEYTAETREACFRLGAEIESILHRGTVRPAPKASRRAQHPSSGRLISGALAVRR